MSPIYVAQSTYHTPPIFQTDPQIRHRRTHERSDGSEGPYGNYSGEEEDYEGEDGLGSLEEASPNSENGYLPQNFGSLHSMAMSMPMSNSGMAAPSQLINTQHLMQQQL
jgi:transcription factor STE12